MKLGISTEEADLLSRSNNKVKADDGKRRLVEETSPDRRRAKAHRAAAKLQQQPSFETTRAICYGGGLGLRQTKVIWYWRGKKLQRKWTLLVSLLRSEEVGKGECS
ncbi:hypothetical protein D5086_022982 [Populus alba]|uniref:Uncharacterized protein n=1 Tax=Populus alba TaxID=43335 RepID=A0ACC4B9D7_POPAL